MHFSTLFFLNVWWFWPPKTTPKSNFFCTFFENVDFVKIVLSPRRRAYFQGSGPPKIHPKSMPKRIRKKHRKKTSQKSIWASVSASKPPPKSTQHRKNSKKIASRKKLQKNRLGPHRKLKEGKPFGTQPDHPTIFPMISTSSFIHSLTSSWSP